MRLRLPTTVKGWAAVVVVAAVLGGIGNANRSTTPTTPATSTAASSASSPYVPSSRAAAAPTAPVELCKTPTSRGYGMQSGCYPGGEIAEVATVVDGDTLTLTDGRTIQILGIDAPESTACAGPSATEYLASLVSGAQSHVKLHEQPGVTVDAKGNLLRYVQYGDAPYYPNDTGLAMILAGWATAYPEHGANPEYAERLTRLNETNKATHDGMYGPPCGPPYPAPTGSSSGGSVDLDVPGDGNMRDGALTGGFCARKWWC